MIREAKIAGTKRRIRAWLFFVLCGLAVLWFGDYLEGLASGMGDSIISLGVIWVGASLLLFVVNLIAFWIEKKKLDKEE
ncbi:MAG: hypothetical protein DRP51_11430 [Candidatus Zixiibacteriota bacterium]|nr:MAG: hypothetical protein DRP51_11430 [candidate division Zixibacteria bacterium]